MVNLYRKFFLFLAVLVPLFACALPNFAALVPTTPGPPATTVFVEVTRSESDDSEVTNHALADSVQVPENPVSVNQLASSAQLPDQNELNRTKIIAGARYQLRRPVTLSHTPLGGENLIYSVSAGGRLQLKGADGTDLPNMVAGESGGGAYVFLPQAPSSLLQLQVEIDSLPAGSDHLMLTVEDLSQSRNVIFQQTGFITEEILERAKVDATVGKVLVASLQPSPEFDGVLELYGPGGYILTLDENGAGEAETLVYEPDQSGEWVYTIFGFQDSFGDFTLTVIELP